MSPFVRMPSLLTPQEVAELLRVTPRTVNRYAADGRLRRVKIGQRLSRYRREDVLVLIDPSSTSNAPRTPRRCRRSFRATMMQATSTPRRATITLKDGRVYVADRVELASGQVMFTGRLRIRDLSGERFYATRERTIRLAEVKAIDWHKDRARR